MTSRDYDLIIYGASGFTGKYVVEEVVNTIDDEKITWAIAGRNIDKLRETLQQVGFYTGRDLKNIPILVVDAENNPDVQSMCKSSKCIINCVGPYLQYGYPIVEECILEGTHYIDMCGETTFLDTLHNHYHQRAQNSCVYIIPACGCAPADLAMILAKKKSTHDTGLVEAFFKMKKGKKGSSIHIGTLKSILAQISSINFIQGQSETKTRKRKGIFYHEDFLGWCTPMRDANTYVVNKTQEYLKKNMGWKSVSFQGYILLPSVLTYIHMLYMNFLLRISNKFKTGKSILLKFAKWLTFGVFSNEGPSREQVLGGSFTIRLTGRTPNDKSNDNSEKVLVTVTGPEPGYLTTPICMVQSAYLLLQETPNLPERGGVYTPGAAFIHTSIIQRLKKRNVQFRL